MKFNFKNLSENTKRIRIIPKYGAELSVNVGVDNPTAMIDVNGVISVCLSPNETPTISCDGAIDSIGIGDINYEHVVKVNGIEIDLLNDVISSSDGIYTVQKGDIIFLAKLEIEAAIGFKNNSVNNLVFEIDVSSNPYDEPIHTNWIKPAFGQPDNPTYYYDAVNKIITFCLSPTAISCDGATNYVDFAILVREGVSHDVVSTSLSLIFDDEVLPPMTPPPDWIGESQGDPFPYEIPSGFQNATLTSRFYNLSDVNRRVEVKSLSEDIKVFTYNNPTSIQLSDDNSHVGACLSKGCVPSMLHFGDGIYDLDYGTLYGMNMTLQTPKGTVSGDFLVPLPEYSNTLYYLLEQYLYENISLISDSHAEQMVTGGGGGSAFIQVYGNIRGGNGSLGGSPFDLILKPLEGDGFDVYGFHFENSETVIRVCGLENFPGV